MSDLPLTPEANPTGVPVNPGAHGCPDCGSPRVEDSYQAVVGLYVQAKADLARARLERDAWKATATAGVLGPMADNIQARYQQHLELLRQPLNRITQEAE